MTKDQRIARLRDALAHIANASSDDDYNAAPAWAAAAVAADDQLAIDVTDHQRPSTETLTFGTPRLLPRWYKLEYQTLEAAGPLLQACATRGMTATEALDELVKLHEKLFAPPPEVTGALDGDEVLACWKDWFADATAGETIADPDTHED